MKRFAIVACVLAGATLFGTPNLSSAAMSDSEYEAIQQNYARPTSSNFGSYSSDAELDRWWVQHLVPYFESAARNAPERTRELLSVKREMQKLSRDINCRFLSPAYSLDNVVHVCPEVLSIFSSFATVLNVAIYANLNGIDAEEYLKFVNDYYERELPRYFAQITTGQSVNYVCDAHLLLFRFLKKKSSAGCESSAYLSPEKKLSEFNEWYLAEVRRRDQTAEQHITALHPLGFYNFHTMYLYAILHEIGHVVQGHSSTTFSFSEKEEVQADIYATKALLETGHSAPMLWAVLLSTREAANLARRAFGSNSTKRVNAVFSNSMQSIRDAFSDPEIKDAVKALLGQPAAIAFESELRKYLDQR